jgi:hypothetical protein
MVVRGDLNAQDNNVGYISDYSSYPSMHNMIQNPKKIDMDREINREWHPIVIGFWGIAGGLVSYAGSKISKRLSGVYDFSRSHEPQAGESRSTILKKEG